MNSELGMVKNVVAAKSDKYADIQSDLEKPQKTFIKIVGLRTKVRMYPITL